MAIGTLFLILPYGAEASYCDRVKNPTDPLFDPLLLWCEDWESDDYYLNTLNSWIAGEVLGGLWNRGADSRFQNTYRNGTNNCLFHSTDPLPLLGLACQFANCTGTREYVSINQGNLIGNLGRDAWGPAVNVDACVDVQRQGDIADEVSGLTLTGGNSGGGQVFEGNNHFAYRIGPGQTAGIEGTMTWDPRTEIGLTMALAYSSNLNSPGASPLLDSPWKHDEWGSLPASEHWNLGLTGTADREQYPYSPFMFNTSEAACNIALSGATVHVGTADCTDAALRMGASSAQYIQSRDFPWGMWKCHQAHIKGMGTANMEIKITHHGTVAFYMTGFDARTSLANMFYDGVNLNSFANANQGTGGEIPTTETAYRYQDNIHVRNGAPVSCAQIGFGSGGGVPPPPGDTPSPQGGQSSGCFIATAAFGSPLAREVRVLREFRDRLLLTNAPGRLLVGTYYWLSPPLARVVAMHEGARAAARGVLWPLVWAAQLALLSPALALAWGGLMATPVLVIILYLGWRVRIFGRRKASRPRATAFPPPVPASEHTQV